jgi:hypothetical protein
MAIAGSKIKLRRSFLFIIFLDALLSGDVSSRRWL